MDKTTKAVITAIIAQGFIAQTASTRGTLPKDKVATKAVEYARELCDQIEAEEARIEADNAAKSAKTVEEKKAATAQKSSASK